MSTPAQPSPTNLPTPLRRTTIGLLAVVLAVAASTVLLPTPAQADPAVPASASGPLLAQGSLGVLDSTGTRMASYDTSGGLRDVVDTGIGSLLASGAGVLPDGDLAVGLRRGVKRVNPLTLRATGDLQSNPLLQQMAVSPTGDVLTAEFDGPVRRQRGGSGDPVTIAQATGTVSALVGAADGTVYLTETEARYTTFDSVPYKLDIGTLVRIAPDGARTELARGLNDPQALSLSSDASTIYVLQGANPVNGSGSPYGDGSVIAYPANGSRARVITSVANRFANATSMATLPDGSLLLGGDTCLRTSRPDFQGNGAACLEYANALTRVDPGSGAVSDFARTSFRPGPIVVYTGGRVPSATAQRPLGVADTLSATVQNTSFGRAEIRLPVMANDRFTGERGFVRVADRGTLPEGASPSEGSVRAEGDTIVYRPTEVSGTFWFTYYVWNDDYRSGPVRVDLTINPAPVIQNDARPVAVPDQYVALAGQPLVVPAASGFLINDTDADPVRLLDLFYLPVPDDSGPFINRNGTRAPQHGTLDLNLLGEGFVYTPDAGFTGTDTFVYGAIDGVTDIKPIPDSQLGTVTITVVAPPRPDDTTPTTQRFDAYLGIGESSTPVGFVAPRFTSSRGPVTTTCRLPGAPGSVVTSSTAFPVGSTVVTCRATDDLGQTTGIEITVEVHSVTVSLSADRATAKTGERVVYTILGRTDDGRDLGDVSSRVSLSVGSFFPGACESGNRCYRTSPGPLRPFVTTRAGRPISGAVAPEVTVVTGDPARLSLTSGGGQTSVVNGSLSAPLAVRIADAYDNPAAGAPVTFTVTSGSAGFGDALAASTTVSSENDGSAAVVLRTGPTPGPITVRVSSPGTTPVEVTGRSVDGRLSLVSGSGQRVVAGDTAAALVLSVVDGGGQPLSEVPITFEVVSGSATFAGAARTTVRSGSDGRVSAVPQLTTAAGPVVVRVSGLGAPLEVTLTVVAGPASALTVTPSASEVVAGAPVRFSVTGADRFGNATGDLTAATTFGSNDPGVSCQQSSCTATTAGPVTVTATYAALAPVAVPLRVVAGPTASLLLTPSSTTSVAGTKVTFAVTGRDTFGNPTGDRTGSSVLATSSAGASCAAAACTGTVTGSYAVSAKSAGLTSNTATVAVTPAAPAVVTASAGSGQSAVAGASFANPLVATVNDAFGNPVPGTTVTFTLPTGGSSGTAAFAGGATTAQVVTRADGTATSPALGAGSTVGPITATAAVAGVADPAAYSLAVTQAGPPRADLALTLAVPSRVAAGSTTTLVVTLKNTGPSAATKARTAVLVPRGWSVVNAGGATAVGRQVLVLDTATIGSGASVTWTLTLRAPTTKGYALLAGVSLSGTQDPKLANNLAAAAVQLT